MSMIDTHRRELTRLMEKQAALKNELHRHESDAAKASGAARRYEDQARRTTSQSSATGALNSAKRERDKALQASKKAATTAKSIADNARDQDSRRRSLEAAQRSADQALERETQRRLQKEKSDRESLDRAEAKRRQGEKTHAREVARLSAAQVHYIHIRPPEPEKLSVLYLTGGAGQNVRADIEVRRVQQALRGAKYRDAVTVEQRPAATFQDLLDGLNDVVPHVVHFSGHGGDEAIVMEDGGAGKGAPVRISFELFFKAIAATDKPPKLLVLNACDTVVGVEAILPTVPVVIAMSDDVLDLAAIVFAPQFYAALGAGLSVGSALAQAKVAIEAAMLEGEQEHLPTAIVREDVNIDELILVKPTR